jgi:hypothetical protein
LGIKVNQSSQSIKNARRRSDGLNKTNPGLQNSAFTQDSISKTPIQAANQKSLQIVRL